MANWLTGSRGKLLLALVLLVGAAGLVYWRARPASGLPDQISFVCVESGKVFHLSRYNVASVPAKNPDTGAATLLPCMKDEHGVLRVSSRCREALAGLGEKNRYVDAQTFEVRSRP
jgi:hypothetical protein